MDKNKRISSAASPPRTTNHSNHNSSYTSHITGYNNNNNTKNHYDNRNNAHNRNYYNENRKDQNYRVNNNNYLGIKKPFKPLTTASTFKPSIYHRKPLPIRTSFSKNYKDEAGAVLPKFSDFKPYKGKPFDAQGYRDPKYFDSMKRTSRNISRTFTNSQTSSGFKDIKTTFGQVREQVQVVLSPPNSLGDIPNINYKSSTSKDSSHFQIKIINSYKEFCKIKVKGTIGMGTIYETISFLKLITRTKTSVKPILLFFDRVERVFYGAAVVSLDEISEKEQIDTNTLESLIFRLNWIFLSEVEEEIINLDIEEDSTVIDPQKGFELLKLMEQSETQLHDVKKLNPVALKLKPSRLEELEEFFKLTENNKEETRGGNISYDDKNDDFELDFDKPDEHNSSEYSSSSDDIVSSSSSSSSSDDIVSSSSTDIIDDFEHEHELIEVKNNSDIVTVINSVNITTTATTITATTATASQPVEDSDDDFFADYE